MLKRSLILLLILALLSSLLVACNGGGKENETTPDTDDGEITTSEDGFELSVEGLDFGNKEIVIQVRGDDETVKEIGVEDDGTALSAELVERTLATEERLNIVVTISKGEVWIEERRSRMVAL